MLRLFVCPLDPDIFHTILYYLCGTKRSDEGGYVLGQSYFGQLDKSEHSKLLSTKLYLHAISSTSVHNFSGERGPRRKWLDSGEDPDVFFSWILDRYSGFFCHYETTAVLSPLLSSGGGIVLGEYLRSMTASSLDLWARVQTLWAFPICYFLCNATQFFRDALKQGFH